MAKYLIKASYSPAGTKGLLKDGGTKRRAAVAKMTKKLGGKVESFYYAYGDADVYSIVDLPDPRSAIALSLNINATGLVNVSTTPLIMPDEIDAAIKKSVFYRAPGT